MFCAECQEMEEPKLSVKAVQELYYFLYGNNPSNFTAQLYLLIGKADPRNLTLIAQAFPDEVAVWIAWQQSLNQKRFFEEYRYAAMPPLSEL